MFLYLICLGCFVQTSAILPASADESHAKNEKQLDQACMAVPWLLALGHIIVYSSLFTKLWRVNKVLQFTRRQIKVQHVAWPMGILMVTVLVILSLWTIIDPLRWNRVEVNEFTGESIGKCETESGLVFVGPLIIVMLIPTVMTCCMAYKTKDVDDSYAESWWIFILIVVQIEVLIIAIPVIVILNEDSTDGTYLGFIFLLWSFPMTTLGLLFVPKMVSYRNALRGRETSPKYKRGEKGKSRVTGVVISSSSHGPNTSSVAPHSIIPRSVASEGHEEHTTTKFPSATDPVPVANGDAFAVPNMDKPTSQRPNDRSSLVNSDELQDEPRMSGSAPATELVKPEQLVLEGDEDEDEDSPEPTS